MRRTTVVALILTLGTFAWSGTVSAATSEPFDAQFRQHFGRGVGAASDPCAVAFCGTGRVVGYGDAVLTIIVTGSVPISLPGCGFALAVTGDATIELGDASSLYLERGRHVLSTG
jgi:hypothetical protein